MSTLNIVNKSPFEKRTLEQCLSRISAGGSVLLIEDAVVAALQNNQFADLLNTAAGKQKLYVLLPDLAARGFADSELLDCFESINYRGFVDLVASHERSHSWL